MPKHYINLFLPFIESFLLSSIVTFPLFVFLKRLKTFQIERKEGPESHKEKRGTPTMGGIGFVLIVALLSFIELPINFHPLIYLWLGYGLIGFLDDLLKVKRKNNLGLTFWQKILLQTFFAALFSFFVISEYHLMAAPVFLKFIHFDNYWLYFFLSVFMVVGGANAANLTDGLDGLLAGSGIITFLCFSFILMKRSYFEAYAFALIIAGALLGFLIYNFPRKRGAWLFMGDVGSLPIGAALSGLAVITHNELILIVIAGLFIIEALSVIMQVVSYRLVKKRIFRMSPLHHHFELLGFTEKKIVYLFWFTAFIFGLIGIFLV